MNIDAATSLEDEPGPTRAFEVSFTMVPPSPDTGQTITALDLMLPHSRVV